MTEMPEFWHLQSKFSPHKTTYTNKQKTQSSGKAEAIME